MPEKLAFRDPDLAKQIASKIVQSSKGKNLVKICHVCGTHEWTITHHGLRSLLPENVEVIAGPGCPVCIVPASEIDEAVGLALRGVIITCFGDLLRVPGSKMSLLDAKAEGADVRIVYSCRDAVRMATKETTKDFAFFAVGFETTSPSTASEILSKPPKNLSFIISHRTIPPAMKLLIKMKDVPLNGFIAPGHVSTIIGLAPYEEFPKMYNMPVVVAGFEPLDVLMSIYMIVKQLGNGRPALENEYTRAVRFEGNRKAQGIMKEVFRIVDSKWRGLGNISGSGLALKEEFKALDARAKYDIRPDDGVDTKPGCQCPLVIIGKIKPIECPSFMKSCNPQRPIGACMVSTEGTCRIWATARSDQFPQTRPVVEPADLSVHHSGG
jgi:hydrogenase expression/formation protein HypD